MFSLFYSGVCNNKLLMDENTVQHLLVNLRAHERYLLHHREAIKIVCGHQSFDSREKKDMMGEGIQQQQAGQDLGILRTCLGPYCHKRAQTVEKKNCLVKIMFNRHFRIVI